MVLWEVFYGNAVACRAMYLGETVVLKQCAMGDALILWAGLRGNKAKTGLYSMLHGDDGCLGG